MNVKTKNKYGTARLTIKNGEINCLVDFYSSKDQNKRIFWLCFSNKKHGEKIWGKDSCESKPHFCLIIPKVITLDTAHVGKKLCGRLNLTRLGKKDYHVYSSGDDVMECGCK